MRWWFWGITLLAGLLVEVTQPPGTETTCPPQVPNSFCVIPLDRGDTRYSNIAFSPDGKLVAVAVTSITPKREPAIRVWQVAGGKLIYELHGHLGEITTVHFSPDGKLLATSSISPTFNPADGGIKLWEVASGKLIRTLQPPGLFNDRIAFSPNGKLLASTAYKCTSVNDCVQADVIFWDAASGAEVRRIAKAAVGPGIRRIDLVFISDELLVTSSPPLIRIWQVSTGRLVQALFVTRDLGATAVSPDGRLLVDADSGFDELTIWEVSSWKKLGVIQGFQAIDLSFSPDSQFLAGSWIHSKEHGDHTLLQIWRVGNRIEDWKVARILVLPLPGFGYGFGASAFSPKGDILAIIINTYISDGMGQLQLWYIGDLK